MDKLVGEDSTGGGEVEILGVITKPFVNLIVQIDKSVLECWSQEGCTKHDNSSLIKSNCAKKAKKIFYRTTTTEVPAYLLEGSSSTPMPDDGLYKECNNNIIAIR